MNRLQFFILNVRNVSNFGMAKIVIGGYTESIREERKDRGE